MVPNDGISNVVKGEPPIAAGKPQRVVQRRDAIAIASTAAPADPALIARLFRCVDARAWDALTKVFAHNIVYERPGYPPLLGFQEVLHFYRELRVVASGEHHLHDIIIDEDRGACWGRFVGQHKDGSAIEEGFADVYTFKAGKITTRRTYFFRPAL
jgi:ketosteroid isomerase-like protein